MKRGIDSTKKWSGEMISDVDGNISSKRIITFIVVIAILISWGADLFFNMETKEFIFEGLMIIVLTGLGTSVAEKFSISRNRNAYSDTKSNKKYDSSHIDDSVDEVID
jgi:hypothetical protein